MSDRETESDRADFGPRGYLPDRAARRARKIVLREQMGLGWPIAAVVAALIVVTAGGWFLFRGSGAPGPPFAVVATLADVPLRGVVAVDQVLVVRAPGSVKVLSAPDQAVTTCPGGQLQTTTTPIVTWDAAGRVLDGPGMALQRIPATVFDGLVYANLDQTTWTTPDAAAAPRDVVTQPCTMGDG